MAQRNEGEGSRPAARASDKHTRHFVKTGRARKSSRKAAARGEDPTLSEKSVPGRDPKPDPDLD